jgi:large subunit ribosomal protein L30
MTSQNKRPSSPQMIVVRQVGSSIRATERQKQTVRGLGLRRLGQIRELQDTPSIRGMLVKVAHLVEIVGANS